MLTLPIGRWRPVFQLVGPQRLRVAALAGVSVLGGLLEASFLVLITRAALALVGTADRIALVGAIEISTWPTLLIAAALVGGRLVLALVGVSLATQITASTGIGLRNQVADSFLHASWSV